MESPGITREALERYLNRRVEELREMKRFLEQERFQDIAMWSHKIQGSAHTFGLESVGQIAEKIEELAEKLEGQKVSDSLTDFEKEVHGAIEKLNVI